jgi:hypothetical protein
VHRRQAVNVLGSGNLRAVAEGIGKMPVAAASGDRTQGPIPSDRKYPDGWPASTWHSPGVERSDVLAAETVQVMGAAW